MGTLSAIPGLWITESDMEAMMAARVLERYRPIDGVPFAAAYVDADDVVLAENESLRALRRTVSAPAADGSLATLFVDEDRDEVRQMLAGRRRGYRRASVLLTVAGTHASVVAEFIPIVRKSGTVFWQILLRPSERRLDAPPELVSRAVVTAGIVHDLRAPVQVVLGWASLLRRKLDDPECIEHALRTIERNAGQMIGLLEDLLDQTKPAWTRPPARRRPVDLIELVTSQVRSIQPLADDAGVQVSMSLDTPALAVDGDDVQLRRIVMNLLGNAVKFTPPRGRIECRLWRADGWAGLAVTDDGPGIPPEFLSRVFDPYVRGPHPRLQTEGGLGLGLAIVRHLVELHGGTVTATSGGPGCGTTFTVLLPVLAAITPQEQTGPVAVLRTDVPVAAVSEGIV